MNGAARVVVTLAVFTTMLGLVVVRPRGWHEAWWTVLGAAAMLALGLVPPRQALDAVLAGRTALLFLLSLLTLSLLVGKSGFFDWAAIRSARFASGNARALYRNVFVLGAIVTAILSLDTTAVILTPVVLALIKRLKLPATPYIVLCAFVANIGSLVLPISNLTNILFAEAFHLSFSSFASRMLGPQVVALSVTYGLLRWHFRRELPARFESDSLPALTNVVPHRAYFRICVTVLVLVFVGYFLAPLVGVAPYVVAFAGSAVLAIAGFATGCVQVQAVGELAWGVFPFVIGLFCAVRGLENIGIIGLSSSWFSHLAPEAPETLLIASGATALASNVMNNLPSALVARSVLSGAGAHEGTVLATLVGADVGPLVTPFASLATMLVLDLARRDGHQVRVGRLLMLGLWATPLLVASTTTALILSVALLR